LTRKGLICLICTFLLGAASAAAEETCPRGEPEALFQGKEVKSEIFTPVSNHEANEEVVFNSGDRLLIRNWGCEYFVIFYRYESAKLLVKSGDTFGVFKKSVELLQKIAAFRPNSVFDDMKAAETLDKMITEGKELTLGQSYPVEGDGFDFLQTRVVVKGGGSLKNGRGGFIEIELGKGPL
jgi:hypothetical protein